MNEAEKKAAAQVDPAVRSMYEEYKKVKRVTQLTTAPIWT